MSDDTSRGSGDRTRPPAQAKPPAPADDPATGPGMRNTDPSATRENDARAEAPSERDYGAPSFANTNIAADQRRQGQERGAGLGAGGSDNRAARYDESDARGDVPEDDLD